MSLKPFRKIPENAAEWSQWMTEQDIPDPVSDTILTGSATFIGATPRTVNVDESSNDYIILIDAAINETFWTTNKTVSSFQLNSSNSSSTATVKWVLIR